MDELNDYERRFAYERLRADGCTDEQALRVLRLGSLVATGKLDPAEPTEESKRLDFLGYLLDHGYLSDGDGPSCPLPRLPNPDPPDRPPWVWTGYPPDWAARKE